MYPARCNHGILQFILTNFDYRIYGSDLVKLVQFPNQKDFLKYAFCGVKISSLMKSKNNIISKQRFYRFQDVPYWAYMTKLIKNYLTGLSYLLLVIRIIP